MDQLEQFKLKLAMLDDLLGKMKPTHSRVRELKRSVQVLKAILKDDQGVKNPYGPKTAIVRFSIQ